MANKQERTFVLNESQLLDVVNYAYQNYGLKPEKKLNERLFDEFRFLNEDEEMADADEEKTDKVTEEQLKVDALKTAVKLARLMNKVTPEDMLEISTKVAAYLKEHRVGDEYTPIGTDDTPPQQDEEADDETEETASETKDEAPVEEEPDLEEFVLDDEDAEEANEGIADIPDEFII